uniref:Uncharacterized protein n=1 Tax=Mycena chlorophos TaxID=658473 RepID=A0ABQ0LDT9_MYCCL|nr:predicted protein [Mycena chlorophos]
MCGKGQKFRKTWRRLLTPVLFESPCHRLQGKHDPVVGLKPFLREEYRVIQSSAVAPVKTGPAPGIRRRGPWFPRRMLSARCNNPITQTCAPLRRAAIRSPSLRARICGSRRREAHSKSASTELNKHHNTGSTKRRRTWAPVLVDDLGQLCSRKRFGGGGCLGKAS